ncbi:MAG: type II secretion system F family protein [Gemmatimonadota bacterium]
MTRAELVLFAGGAILIALFVTRTAVPSFKNRLARSADRTSRDLREEFLFLSTRQVMAVLLASGTILAAATLVFVRDLAWAAVLAAAPTLLSGVAVSRIRRSRRRLIVSHLPGFLDVLSGYARAGHSLQEALLESVPLLPGALRAEISWMSQQVRLGTPLAEALRLWEERIPCEEVSLAVRPLRLALPAGGNVVCLLERTRDVLRARIRMQEKLRSMTAQARLQACVLTLLPPAFIAVLSRIDPAFLPRCLGSFAGKAILAVAGVLQVLGWLTIRRILAVKA